MYKIMEANNPVKEDIVDQPKFESPPQALRTHHDQFDLTLAHELRHPLTNIILSVEMLKDAIKEKHLGIYLDIIMRGSMRINNLINELLASQQANEMKAKEYSIHQLLDEVLELVNDRVKLKNIEVIKDYAAQNFNVVLNEPEMKISLTNIIVNAIEAMTPGKGQLKIVTGSDNGKFSITVEDNGCGISKLNLEKIFTPYFTDKPQGVGLGLTSAYDILRSNHISVHVESIVGKGTRFFLLFDKINKIHKYERI